MQYQHRPTRVNALKWTGDNIDDIARLLEWNRFDHDKLHGLRVHINGIIKEVEVGMMVVVDLTDKRREVMTEGKFIDHYESMKSP